MTTGLTIPQSLDHAPHDGYRLAELASALRGGATLIAASAAAGLLLATAAAWLIPARYTATAIIMPPQQQQSTASALLGQLGSIASLGGRDLGLKNPSDLYIGIARSQTVADALIERFGLQSLYRERTLVSTRKRLASRTQMDSGKDTLIKISVEDADPRRAADMANAYVDELYKQNSRLALTESSQRRLFFERQLDTEKKALAAAEVSLKQTQKRTSVIQVNTQAEVAIRALAQVRGEIAAREAGLDKLKIAATPANPEVVREEAELAALRAQLQKLERGPSRPGDPLLSPANIPDAGLDYLRAVREVAYHQTLFELLAKQFVAAKIDEAKDAPMIQIVDRALPPDLKSWPPRAIFSAAGLLAGAILAAAFVLARHAAREARYADAR